MQKEGYFTYFQKLLKDVNCEIDFMEKPSLRTTDKQLIENPHIDHVGKVFEKYLSNEIEAHTWYSEKHPVTHYSFIAGTKKDQLHFTAFFTLIPQGIVYLEIKENTIFNAQTYKKNCPVEIFSIGKKYHSALEWMVLEYAGKNPS